PGTGTGANELVAVGEVDTDVARVRLGTFELVGVVTVWQMFSADTDAFLVDVDVVHVRGPRSRGDLAGHTLARTHDENTRALGRQKQPRDHQCFVVDALAEFRALPVVVAEEGGPL